jgi:uncharacterized protein YndB with AHSA1/START domain
MSVKKETDGRRWVAVDVEVPGTPEQVWQAIATGPGVTSWFVPTRFEAGPDGVPTQVVSSFGPGMDATATITSWEPPHRFTASSGDLGPSAPVLATEWVVEGRAGGLCAVRVVHSLFADSDDWDGQLESTEKGWPGFFRLLGLYLRHFPGQSATTFQAMGISPKAPGEVWAQLVAALGVPVLEPGGRVSRPAGAPPLAGTVESLGVGEVPHVLYLLLEEPAPGIASLGLHPMGGKTYVALNVFAFGPEAAAAAKRDGAGWQEWLTALLTAG